MTWGIPESDQARFRTLFAEMTGNEIDKKLTGSDVRPVLMKSNLDVAKLGQIWVLADIDQDGCLDEDEFIVSMYLTYKALNEGSEIPSSLPVDIIPPSKREGSLPVPPNAVPVVPANPVQSGSVDYSALSDLTSGIESNFATFSSFPNSSVEPVSSMNPSMNLITPPTPLAPALTSAPNVSGPIPNLLTGGGVSVPAAEVPYLVTPDKYSAYEGIFGANCDPRSGLISAMAARDVFLQSGLPNATLAQVWNLSDSNQSGSLNGSQFILAMHLLAAVLQGHELPSVITESMLRAASGNFTELEKLGPSGSSLVQMNVPQVPAELQSLQNEMTQLQMELNQLENQVQQLKTQQESGGDQVTQMQVEIEKNSKSLTELESETSNSRNQLTSKDSQKMKLVQEANELNSKLVSERGALAMAENQLQALCSGPAPGQVEKARLEGLKAQENNADTDKNDSLKLLTEVRSERIRMEKILSDLEEEKFRLDSVEPEMLPEVPPSMSQMSLNSGINLTSPTSTVQSPDTAAITNLTGLAQNIKIEEPANEANLASVAKPVEVVETVDPEPDPFSVSDSNPDPFGKADSTDPFGAKKDSADPFGGTSQDSGDPFGAAGSAGSDPFGKPDPVKEEDPFGKSEDPFGAADPFGKSADPFGSGNDPFGSSSDPFGGASADPFGGGGSDPFGDSNPDPFGESKNDPFDQKPVSDPSSNSDPWGAFSVNPPAPDNSASFDFGAAFGNEEKPKIKTEKKAPSRPPPARPPPARPAPIPTNDSLL